MIYCCTPVFTHVRAGIVVGRLRIRHYTSTQFYAINKLIQGDREISIRQIANRLDIHKSTASRVVRKTLKHRKSSVNWVPHKLMVSLKVQRMNVCETLTPRPIFPCHFPV